MSPSVEAIIAEFGLTNWLEDFPWLTGHLGNPNSPIWFVGENPSLTGVENVHKRAARHSENLQWNSHDGDRLLREALTEAGLKEGQPQAPGGWKCYITNAIKEPDRVGMRNKKKGDSAYWKDQARRWLPVLQAEIDAGRPKVLVALGAQVEKILQYMRSVGLKAPPVRKINHYSYVMFRPEAGTHRGPRHSDRIREFKESVRKIANEHVC
jgi:uracil-DNA glycosylase